LNGFDITPQGSLAFVLLPFQRLNGNIDVTLVTSLHSTLKSVLIKREANIKCNHISCLIMKIDILV